METPRGYLFLWWFLFWARFLFLGQGFISESQVCHPCHSRLGPVQTGLVWRGQLPCVYFADLIVDIVTISFQITSTAPPPMSIPTPGTTVLPHPGGGGGAVAKCRFPLPPEGMETTANQPLVGVTMQDSWPVGCLL